MRQRVPLALVSFGEYRSGQPGKSTRGTGEFGNCTAVFEAERPGDGDQRAGAENTGSIGHEACRQTRMFLQRQVSQQPARNRARLETRSRRPSDRGKSAPTTRRRSACQLFSAAFWMRATLWALQLAVNRAFRLGRAGSRRTRITSPISQAIKGARPGGTELIKAPHGGTIGRRHGTVPRPGTYSPGRCSRSEAGVIPVLSRNCDAPSGDEPGRLHYAEANRPSEDRAVRSANASEPPTSANAEVFV